MSMKNELLVIRGRIAETKHEIAEKELLANADLMELRTILDPYEDSIEKINAEKVVAISERFHGYVTELRELKEKLSRMQGDIS